MVANGAEALPAMTTHARVCAAVRPEVMHADDNGVAYVDCRHGSIGRVVSHCHDRFTFDRDMFVRAGTFKPRVSL
jgi:hypothetical protein